ncbi:hypothetical protein Ga0061079_11025 [Apibacter mensalis]|uniref:Uncharacterized protein n=1 Tax=Apibacter mensalis TaxID=1586267 RepID=A0A0X3AQU7_9FLAO|nr:hypothetical protein [Apibacter mensalis]CVK16742.1 hypothetical protein Ga0061079_11025 [Apibacter mensalis]
MKSFLLILSTIFNLLSCSSKNNINTFIVGNDADEHGCKRSTGSQWSQTKNECIQPFTEGIKLKPVSAASTQAAYILVDYNQIEIFSTEISGSVVVHKINNNKWKNESWEIKKVNDKYILEKDGKTLYKSN